MMTKTATIGVLFVGALFTASAHAVKITGDISFSGGQAVCTTAGTCGADGGSLTFPKDVQQDQADRSGEFATILATVGDISGDYFAELTWGAGGAINPGLVWGIPSAGIPLLSFTLTSGTIQNIGGVFVLVDGVGTVSLDQAFNDKFFGGIYEDTEGVFYLTSQSPFTTFSASTTGVPVPAAAWLFGSGLVGLAGIARKRRIAA